MNLAEEPQSGDMDKIRSFVRGLFKSCGTCHKWERWVSLVTSTTTPDFLVLTPLQG